MTLYDNKIENPAKGARNRVRRHAERGRYDRETIDAILDAGFVGHLAFIDDGLPYAIATLYVRVGDQIFLHGAPRSRLLRTAASGAELCFTVTHVDGLVLARSVFHHSVNFRSVVVFGTAQAVRERAAKLDAMQALVEHIVPGRTAEARGPNETELKATEIVALTIAEASAKVRTGGPVDVGADLELPLWAGHVPLHTAAGEPIPGDGCTLPVPGYVGALYQAAPAADR